MSSRYAEGTDVSSDRSRAEIERTLARYDADEFGYVSKRGAAAIMFKANGREIRFLLPLPDKDSREFTHSNHDNPRPRTAVQVEAAYEQAVKQKWRALALVIKAKLEAVEAGIVTFEDEFAMHMILPGGSTVREHVLPAIQTAYETGSSRQFLAIENNK